MIIPRREFLSLLGVTAGAAGLGGCGPSWEVPDRLVELAQRGPGLERQIQTVCGLCPAGCGLTVRLVDGLPVGLKGNRNHPLNRGGLCPVGQASLEVLYSPQRLKAPLRRNSRGEFEPVGWEEAIAEIAERLGALRDRGAGGRIGLLHGSTSSLFEDLLRQFLGVLGSANLACTEGSAVLPYSLSQGVDRVPGFDLSNSDVVLSFGLDLFEDGPAPIHAISALIGSRTTADRGALLHVGSRLSPSAAKAQRFVPVRPGTHGAFALGVANVLVREGRYDRDFVAQRTFGFDDWTEQGQQHLGFRRLLLERYYPDRVAQICGCPAASVADMARRFARASAPLALVGGEATAGSNASWNVMAVHALNVLMGVFNRPGGVMPAPQIPLTALPPLQPPPGPAASIFGRAGLGRRDPVELLATRAGDAPPAVEALFLVETNPVHWKPRGAKLAEALQQIPLVVALTPFLDESARQADLVLPTHVFLEGWQAWSTPLTTALSVLGLAQPVVEPLFETRHPGDLLLELARRAVPDLASAVPWSDYTEYLKYRLTALASSGQGSLLSGAFEESWRHFLEQRGWRFLRHRDAEDFWNELVRQAGWWSPPSSPGHWEWLFPNQSQRYEFFSRTLRQRLIEEGGSGESAERSLQRAIESLQLAAGPDEVCLPHYEPPSQLGEGDLTLVPFRPITARGDLGSASPMVMEMFGYPVLSGWESWAELSAETAQELGVDEGDWVALESEEGSIEARVRVQPGAAEGGVYVALGLGRELAEHRSVVGSNPIRIMLADRDGLSGNLSLTSTRVRLRLLQRAPAGSRRWTQEEGGHV